MSDSGGAEGFLAGLRRCGQEPTVQGQVVTFTVVPVEGALAGTTVPTGVALDELAPWSAAPPHWVHLPASVILPQTNADSTLTLPGWLRHSRNITGWVDAAEPVSAWLAHVRGVLAQAVA